jgi:hypothetical protein
MTEYANLKSHELEEELYLDEAGKEVDHEDDFSEIVMVANGGKRYEFAVIVDWKSDPDNVIDSVNFILKEKGIDLEFVNIECGDDSCHYGLEKK